MKRYLPFNALEEEIIKPLKNNGTLELGGSTITKVIVFINSVDTIVRIVKECDLKKDEVAILCGDSSRNSFKIRGYNTIDNPNRLPKYTFITSSGFQGIDLRDNEAINVVVSYTGKEYQMVDLNTDLIQATSRQRDRSNPNYKRFIYIYDQSPFDDKTEEELIAEMNEIHNRIETNCKTFKKTKADNPEDDNEYNSTVNTFLQSEDFRRYTIRFNEVYVLNENVFNAERYQILETKKRYTEGFDIMADYTAGSKIKPIVIPEPEKSKKLSYISIMYKYRKNLVEVDEEDENIFDIIIDGSGTVAYNPKKKKVVDRTKFDEEELNSKNFQIVDNYYKSYGKFTKNATYARRMSRVIGDEQDQFNVDVQSLFEIGVYEKQKLQEEMNVVYRKYGIIRKAKANDLIDFGYVMKTK